MADKTVESNASTSIDARAGLWGPYWMDKDKAIIVFTDNGQDLSFARTIDAGVNWTTTEVVAGNVKHVACWFDKETPDDTGTLVHMAWLDFGTNVAYYRTVDVDDASLGTERTVASSLTVNSGANANDISITKTLSGNLIYAFNTKTEIECFRSTDGGTNWTDRTDVYDGTTDNDYVMLFPANTGDNDDAVAIYWDFSANELSIKMYDESANTWTETSIATSMVEDTTHKNRDGTVRHSDKHIILAAHTNDDNASDDLKVWDLTVDSIASPTVTAKTDIFTDQNEAAQAAVIINQQNDDIYVAYLKGGTWPTSLNCVFHKSTNGGTSWGIEQAYSEDTADSIRMVQSGRSVGDDGGRIQFSFYNDDLGDIFVNLVNDIEITAAAPPSGRIMSSLVASGGLAYHGGIAGKSGGLAG